MRKIKVLRQVVLVALLALAIVVVGVYFQADRLPENYRPALLSSQQREAMADDFTNRCQDFYNKSQDIHPYIWTITQERLNGYLASMDEIAANLPGRPIDGDQVGQIMKKIGLADPMIAMDDEVLTLMVRSTDFKKVLSLDLRFSSQSSDRLAVKLSAARIGRLPIPKNRAKRVLAKLQRKLRRKLEKYSSEQEGDIDSDNIGIALAMVITAIDEKPISTEIKIDGKYIRITSVEIADKTLSLHIEPIGRKTLPE